MARGWSGVFAALTTPFDDEGIALDRFRANLERYNQTELAGYVVLGSTGEAVLLDDQEAEAIVREAKGSAAPSKRLVVGTSRESTRATIDFTNQVAEWGADAALVKPPFYYKSLITEEVLRRHFLSLADSCHVPLILYHIPQNTGIPMTPSLLSELSHHPNIAGVKDSSGSLSNLVETLPRAAADFSYLIGAGSVFLPGLILGASGGVLAAAAVTPERWTELYALFRAGKFDQARKLQLDLAPLNKLLTQTLSIPAIKYALDLLGFYGGPPRPPLLSLDERDKERVKQALERLGLL